MSHKTAERWFIPADFMYGTPDEDKDKTWPEPDGPALRAWIAFTMQFLKLTGQHPPGTTMYIPTDDLTDVQKEHAIAEIEAREWPIEVVPHGITVVSKEPKKK